MATSHETSLIREHQHLYFRIGVLSSSDDIGGMEDAANRMSAIQNQLGKTEEEIQNLKV